MRALIVDEVQDLRILRPAGAISYRCRGDGTVGGIAFICPCGCGNESYLPIRGRGHPQEWDWNGDRLDPTLSPSIFNSGLPCRWHGWLRNGEWVSV
jgi:hypothetical protein